MKNLICLSFGLIVVTVILVSCHTPADPEPDNPDSPQGTAVELRKIIWTGDQFVAVGDTIITSRDGITWTAIMPPTGSLPDSLIDITYSNGTYVAISKLSIAVSNDLMSWTYRWICPEFRSLMMVAQSGSKFVISGYALRFGCPWPGCLTVDPFVVNSTDGDDWQAISIGNDMSFSGVVWTDTQFVGVASNIIVTSADGEAWKKDTASEYVKGTLYWTGETLACFGGLGSTGTFSTGTYTLDDHTWYYHGPGSIGPWHHAILADTIYVAVGESGRILTSVDLNTWICRYSTSWEPLYDVVWNGQILVAIGYNTILTSRDGITWTLRHIPD